MIITDYSNQNFETVKPKSSLPLSEVITAGMIFILPIILLLIVTAG